MSHECFSLNYRKFQISMGSICFVHFQSSLTAHTNHALPMRIGFLLQVLKSRTLEPKAVMLYESDDENGTDTKVLQHAKNDCTVVSPWVCQGLGRCGEYYDRRLQLILAIMNND